MTESTPVTGDESDLTADQARQVTHGSSEFLGLTADKSNHDDWDDAKHTIETPDDGVDAHEAIEDFPSATAGPGAYLAMTAEHTGHHGEHSHASE
jgi:hypothetical protein